MPHRIFFIMPLNIKKIRQWVDTCESVTEAADRLEIKPQNLHRMLSGDRADIRLSTLEHLAMVIGVEPGELIRTAKIV